MSNFSPGHAIGTLRKERGMSGSQLAKRAGMSQSKLSRIETDTYVKSKVVEIDRLLNILQAPQEIRERILNSMNEPGALNRLVFNSRFDFTVNLKRDLAHKVIRMHNSHLVPVLLQTPDYHKAKLKKWGMSQPQIATAMVEMCRRQDLLWEARRRYHFLIHEAAFYTSVAGPTVQLGLLDRVRRFVGQRHVKVGITATQASLPPVELGPFALFDDDLLVISNANADMESLERASIDDYLKLFGEIERKADYDQAARAIIDRAEEFFGGKTNR